MVTDTPQDDGLIERVRADLERVQWYDRPLPWVVHTGSSYRRIASDPTREVLKTFPDGNVLHGTIQRSDGHPDLSMGERELEALVGIVNAAPIILDRIAALRAENEAQVEAAWKAGFRFAQNVDGDPDKLWPNTKFARALLGNKP